MLHNVINDVIVSGVCGRWWLAETTETVLGFAYFWHANKYAKKPETTLKQS